jgi:hypothetical protein
MLGQRFGRLMVIARADKKVANGNIQWLCDCGRQIIVDGYRLRSGQTRSCGCLRQATSRENSRKNAAFQRRIGNPSNFLNSLVKSKRNKSGVIGVSFDQKRQCWFARLMVNHHYVLLKSFKSYNEAVAARRQAEATYLHPQNSKMDSTASFSS